MITVSLDPRIYAIRRRLAQIKLVVPVVSPKGGVGKTTISTALALTLAKQGVKAGLLDLDITNPCSHILLGVDVETTKPQEERGILPLQLDNLEFMSIAFYSGNRATPLRGPDIDNAIRELLAITRWSSHILIVDTPPGFSDEVIDIITIAPHAQPLLIVTPSKLALESAKRALSVLHDENVELLGIAVNMCSDTTICNSLAQSIGLELLACIPQIQELETAIGDTNKLRTLLEPYLIRAAEAIRRAVRS